MTTYKDKIFLKLSNYFELTEQLINQWNTLSEADRAVIQADLVLNEISKTDINLLKAEMNSSLNKAQYIDGVKSFTFNSENRLNQFNRGWELKFKILYPDNPLTDERTWKMFYSSQIKDFITGINKAVNSIEYSLNKDSLKKSIKVSDFNTLADAAVNGDTLETMYQVLISKHVIDNQYTLTKSATLLYSLMKRFKQLGYFKKITDIRLHILINDAFKMNNTRQLYKQAEPYSRQL